MKSTVTIAAVVAIGTVFLSSNARAQNAGAADDGAKKGASEAAADDSALTDQDRLMLETAKALAADCIGKMETWIRSNAITEDKLFSYLYYPIPDTNPTKFHTDYDSLSDKEIQDILEKHLKASPDLLYAVMADKNGYVPTHNLKYTQPMTGDPAKDLAGNRTKRIYADKVGLAAARNTQPYLLQSYKRDTGQIMMDLSVPITIDGRHWGNVRLGYIKAQ